MSIRKEVIDGTVRITIDTPEDAIELISNTVMGYYANGIGYPEGPLGIIHAASQAARQQGRLFCAGPYVGVIMPFPVAVAQPA